LTDSPVVVAPLSGCRADRDVNETRSGAITKAECGCHFHIQNAKSCQIAAGT
jgi:hypothetical protein